MQNGEHENGQAQVEPTEAKREESDHELPKREERGHLMNGLCWCGHDHELIEVGRH